MLILEPNHIIKISKKFKTNHIHGRWITINDLENKFFETLSQSNNLIINKIGFSEENRNIYEIIIGEGSNKILIWTQMHGNESTGTKAVMDLIHYLNQSDDPIVSKILSQCSIKIIPILNPDGAEYYTRFNAHKIDLNRDARDLIAKESQLLRSILEDFNPDFCFNLHDQRTIFGVEGTKNPATISFLSPSVDSSRKLTETRIKSMNVIVAMNSLLQQIIPNYVGRYTDEFYPNATGDNFQKLGYPTMLIESGHYLNDYQRESVREFTFAAILQGIYHIGTTDNYNFYKSYFNIPNNQDNFRDLLHKYPNKENEGFQFKEILIENSIKFIPEKIFEDISEYFFHKEIDFEG